MSAAKMVADSTQSDIPEKSTRKRKKVVEKKKVKKKKVTGKKGKKKQQPEEEYDENDLDLDIDIQPISYFVKDRSTLVEEVFHCVRGTSLQRALPDVLKELPLEDLKKRCLDQLEVMSKKRIRRILAGDDPANISSSGTEDEESTEEELEEQVEEEYVEYEDEDEEMQIADSTSQHAPEMEESDREEGDPDEGSYGSHSPTPSDDQEQQVLHSSNEESMDSMDSASKSIARQNKELHRRLEEEQRIYKLKLQSYRSGKQKAPQLLQDSDTEREPSAFGEFSSQNEDSSEPLPLAVDETEEGEVTDEPMELQKQDSGNELGDDSEITEKAKNEMIENVQMEEVENSDLAGGKTPLLVNVENSNDEKGTAEVAEEGESKDLEKDNRSVEIESIGTNSMEAEAVPGTSKEKQEQDTVTKVDIDTLGDGVGEENTSNNIPVIDIHTKADTEVVSESTEPRKIDDKVNSVGNSEKPDEGDGVAKSESEAKGVNKSESETIENVKKSESEVKDVRSESEVKDVKSESETKENVKFESEAMQVDKSESEAKQVDKSESGYNDVTITKSEDKEESKSESEDKEVSKSESAVKEVSKSESDVKEVTMSVSEDKEVSKSESEDKEVNESESDVKKETKSVSEDREVSKSVSEDKEIVKLESEDKEEAESDSEDEGEVKSESEVEETEEEKEEKEEEEEDEESPDVSKSVTQNRMELLELEMRARAIKAMLKMAK